MNIRNEGCASRSPYSVHCECFSIRALSSQQPQQTQLHFLDKVSCPPPAHGERIPEAHPQLQAVRSWWRSFWMARRCPFLPSSTVEPASPSILHRWEALVKPSPPDSRTALQGDECRVRLAGPQSCGGGGHGPQHGRHGGLLSRASSHHRNPRAGECGATPGALCRRHAGESAEMLAACR